MKPILAAVVITAIALGLNAALLRHDPVRDLLTPAPAKVVQGFVGATAAARSGVARNQLASETRAQVSDEALAARAEAFRARHGHYRYEGGDVRRNGEVAEVQARLRTERDGTVARTFRLARDPRTHLWKITDPGL